MKVFAKNAIIKKILIVLVTIIMISNFIMPNYVHAENKEGNKLVNGFFYLLAWAGDAGLSTMQRFMMGTGDLSEDGMYKIKYSPGIIFANYVPALDIDFITASEEFDEVSREITDANSKEEILTLIEKSNLSANDFEQIAKTGDPDIEDKLIECGLHFDDSGERSHSHIKTINGAIYRLSIANFGSWWGLANISKIKQILTDANSGLGLAGVDLYTYGGDLYKVEKERIGDFTVYKCDKAKLAAERESILIKSSSYALKNNIATWYVALRTIALVGLLSVLVYIGIRIILSSSSANDKAKYKNMLKDWLVAICILFVLHYIMAFMTNIVSSLNDVIKAENITLTEAGNRTDKLINTVRTNLGDINEFNGSNLDMAGYTVMYLALVILTGVFTVQYLKRVIYMAFLTMIAPMIALTYPLDKIKDGKAQAFSFWLKEYIFNCLIQPVHLLLYTMLITNAIDFATENILYAIVALAFLVPAEKFIKEMFGMKSSSPVGTLGAAAGGAMVMSMLNKMKAKPPKDGAKGEGSGDSGSGGSSKGVRTASNNATAGQASGANGAEGTSGGSNGGAGNSGSGAGSTTRTSPNYSIGKGLNAVGKKYIYGTDALKSHGKKFTRTLGGAALGAAAATVGFAAQMADGDLLNDPRKALQDVGVATGIAYASGKNLTGRAVGAADRIGEVFKEGAYGKEEYANIKANKAFRESGDYKSLSQKYSGQQVDDFVDSNIRDAKVIEAALESGVSAAECQELLDAGLSEKDIKKYSQLNSAAKKKGRSLSASQLASRMSIAKSIDPTLLNDDNKQGFITYAKRFGLNTKEAEQLRKEINDFI